MSATSVVMAFERHVVVSTVYAASGGSLMAPVLASLGVLGARAEGVKGE